jgi:hypothetical protein
MTLKHNNYDSIIISSLMTFVHVCKKDSIRSKVMVEVQILDVTHFM